MKPDWKGLKYQKTCELPAAQLLQKEREEDFEKRVLKITDMVEKQLYKACKKQEAGLTMRYSILDMQTDVDVIKEWFQIFIGTWSENWTWDDDIKEHVQANIIDRLTEQGVSVEAVKGLYCIDVTLP